MDTVGRYADGLRSESTLAKSLTAATNALREAGNGIHRPALIVKWLCHKDVGLQSPAIANESAEEMVSRQPRHLKKATRRLSLLKQTRLLRCMFGNPFRPVSINPVWLTPTVSNLAQSAYDERIMPSGELDPSRLAVLSDALEESGCDDEEILNHLRSPGPHVRGCWVLDLLLGKS